MKGTGGVWQCVEDSKITRWILNQVVGLWHSAVGVSRKVLVAYGNALVEDSEITQWILV